MTLKRLRTALDSNPIWTSTAHLLASNLAPPLLSLIFIRLVADAAAARDIGLAVAYLGVLTFLSVVCRLGLDLTILREIPIRGQTEGKDIIRKYLNRTGLATLLASGLMVILLPPFMPEFKVFVSSVEGVASTVATLLALTWSTMLDHAFAAQRRSRLALLKNITGFGLRLLIPTIVALEGNPVAIFTAYASGYILSTAIGLMFIPAPGHRATFDGDTITIQKPANIAGANYFTALSASALATLPPLLIVSLWDAATAAHYYFAANGVAFLLLLPHALSIPLVSEGSRHGASAPMLWKAGIRGLTITAIGAAVIALNAESLLLLVAGNEGRAAVPLLQVLAVGALPATVNILLSSYLRVEGRARPLVEMHAFILLLTTLGLIAAGLFDFGSVWIAIVISLAQLGGSVLGGIKKLTSNRYRNPA